MRLLSEAKRLLLSVEKRLLRGVLCEEVDVETEEETEVETETEVGRVARKGRRNSGREMEGVALSGDLRDGWASRDGLLEVVDSFLVRSR